MLEALKFVMRGVARRDYVPGLTHFRIKDQRVTGYNGLLALSAPVDVSFNAAPHAGRFIKALQQCEDVISLRLDGETLLVKSGNFKVSVPCVNLNDVPTILPEGTPIKPHESILEAFEKLFPFIGVDAARPWATGILLANSSAYATNNIVAAEYWLGVPFPKIVNIPSSAIQEAIRIEEDIDFMQVAEASVTFHYQDARWIRSPLLNLNWPNVPGVIKNTWKGVTMWEITPELRKACIKLATFCEEHKEHLYFRPGEVSTTAKGLETGGAVCELSGLPSVGCYHASHLNDVLTAATHIDLTKYPAAIPWHGGAIRGAMLGILQQA